MATELVKVLDPEGGGDWAKFSAAKTAFYGSTAGDLVTDDENVLLLVKGGGNANPDGYAHVNNLITTDGTRTLTIQGASGYRHNGRYNAAGMEGIARFDTTFDASLLLSEANVVLRDMVVIQRSNGGGGVSTLYVNGNDILVERVLAVNHPTGTPTNETYSVSLAITGSAVLRNCVFVVLPSATGHNHTPYSAYQAAGAITGEITYHNCTFVNLGNGVVTNTSRGVYVRNASDTILRNCVIWGAKEPVVGTLEATSSNNAYVGASGTGDVDLTGYTIYDIFVDPDNYDFRPRKGSPLRGAGADLSGAFTDDVTGAQRPADGAYDIGAFQYREGDSRARSRFVVSLTTSSTHRVDGVGSMVIEADTPDAARDRAAVEYDGDSSWASATAEEIDDDEVYVGTAFTVIVEGLLSVSYMAQQGDTIDDIGDALAAALNAKQPIQGAVHNSTTHVLTIAETTDGLGDRTVGIRVTPAGAKRPLQAISGPVGTITHKGASGAALKVEFRDSGVPRIISRS